MVSCGTSSDVGLEFSGFQLATGDYSDLAITSAVKSYPELFLIPIMGVAGLRSFRGDQVGFKLALGAGILGMIGLLIFSSNISAKSLDGNIQLFSWKYLTGYFGSWIAFAVQTISAAIPLYEEYVAEN